jgi:hypothetical protein
VPAATAVALSLDLERQPRRQKGSGQQAVKDSRGPIHFTNHAKNAIGGKKAHYFFRPAL